MAFRFGFANSDEDINADDGDGVYATPSATEPNVPPVREHGLKDLVGKSISLLSSHRKRNTRNFQPCAIAYPNFILFKQCISYQFGIVDVGKPE
jgi:hypothetical protein